MTGEPARDADPGPVGIDAIGRGAKDDFEPLKRGGHRLQNRLRERRVMSAANAGTVKSILETVVKSGTATRAAVPGVTIAGKTGTTEGYGDAWFVGWTKEYTVAIWVGYPDRFKPMETEFQGQPVAGGTYPAGIFKTFVESLLDLKRVKKDTPDAETAPVVPPGSSPPVSEVPSDAATPATTSRAAARPRPPSPDTETQTPPTQPEQAPAQPEPTAAPEQPAPETPARPRA